VIERSEIAEDAWRVTGATSRLRELTAEGRAYLQDEASQLVAQVMNVTSGEQVLDLCAAPGGKTTLMADSAGDRALIVAADRSATRMATVNATTNLHKLASIKPVLLDATQTLPFAPHSFDKVLVDAPCSGTGTLRRNPEIRWRLTDADIHELAANQRVILTHAAEMVKPGGRLLYSTCSVERDENEDVIDEFMRRDEFRLVSTTRTWPHRDGADGFFIAVLERT